MTIGGLRKVDFLAQTIKILWTSNPVRETRYDEKEYEKIPFGSV